MVDDGIDACVLTNPVSIRYATGYRDYTSFQSRFPTAYLIVPADGPVVLHGAYTRGSRRSQRHACRTRRPCSMPASTCGSPRRASSTTSRLRSTEADVGAGATLGVERLLPTTHRVLVASGYRIVDAEPTVELARSRKSEIEIDAMRHAIAVAEFAMGVHGRALRPGVSENQLWSVLHQVNIANDGDWVDGRMLCCGPRTNPWYQEASARPHRGR